MKECYQNMMAQISLGEEARERIADGLAQGGRGRRKVLIRPVLAAACVCLALVGGAFAAEAIFGVPVFRLTDTSPVTGEPLTGFANGLEESAGQAIKQPEEVFSARVLEHAANGQTGLECSSWEEAEEYLGMELMDNAALAEARYAFEEGGEPVSVFLCVGDGVLNAVHATAGYWMNETVVDDGNSAPVRVGVTACVYTEHSPIAAEDMFVQYGFYGDYAITAEEYTNANGLAAVIVAAEDEEYGVTHYYAQFVWNGAAFTVDAIFGPDGDHALTTLKQVLDSFA